MPLKFKTYLQSKPKYAGGKSKTEVGKNQPVYKLSSNENQLGSSPKALAAIQKHIKVLSEYPDRTDARFRIALSQFYDNQLTENQFITTNSGVASIELIVRAFMSEGDECIYSNPAFGPYRGFPKKEGAKAINVPLIGDDFHLNVDGILNAINDKTRLIFITSPNNPTGTILPKDQISQLVNQLPDHVVLIFDEVYYQFADDPDFVRALPFILEGKNVIGINSFSKAYGLAGLRIGYAYSTPEIANYLQGLRIPFMINTLGMEAAIAALGDTAFIERTVQIVHTEKAFLYKELAQLNVKYWPTQANFIMIKPDVDAILFEERMLAHGVMVRPVEGFGAPGCVRVTIGTRAGNEAFLKGLKLILNNATV